MGTQMLISSFNVFNSSLEELKALKEFKSDKDCIILTDDKGVALLMMDRSDCIKKMKELLEDTNTYMYIDPTKNRRTN